MMAIEETLVNLPVAYQEAMKAVVKEGYGDEDGDITQAWLDYEARVQHSFEQKPAPTKEEISQWDAELIAFVEGWRVALKTNPK